MSEQVSEKSAYVLKLSDSYRFDESLKNNIVGIGWSAAKDLSKTKDWNEFKNIILKTHDCYKNSPRSLGQAATSPMHFIHNIEVGDYVVVPRYREFYVAEVKSEAYYNTDEVSNDFAWQRKVEWLNEKKPIPKSYVDNIVQKRFKARQTCVVANDLVGKIEQSLIRKEPINFSDEITEKAIPIVCKALRDTINDSQLENIVLELIKRNGATSAYIPPKNEFGRDADVDIIAVYDNIFRKSEPLQVFYQIKQHEGISDKYGIQQLLNAEVEKSHERVIGSCFITTADEISADAIELAEENNIDVINGSELAEWILESGINIVVEQSK